MKPIRQLAALATLTALSTSAWAAPSGTLNFYTSMQLDVVEPIVEAFEAQFPEVSVDLLYSGSVELEQRIFSEIEAGRLRADVIWAANPALFMNLKEAGWLAAHDSPHKEAIPADLRDEDDMFFAGRVHHMGIGYNTNLVSEDQVPATWEAFLEWGDQAASASPLHSGTNFNLLGAFTQSDELGFEWYERAREAGMQVVRGTGDVTRGVVSGEFAVIKGIDYIMAGQAAEGAPVAFSFPEDGVLALPSPLAVTAESENDEAARAFLDFILSTEGQQVLVDKFFMPVRTDVAPPEGLPSPDEINALAIDFDWMAEHGDALRERFSDLY
ncbi:extracellular solute-binding protein [Halomonas sp. A11-A]|uniref:extracellular solute-binding protein n=1 Tax=Halomonas sp. A11-A TaxID=2183985 RepID=UPI000D71B695|nr:extracellular solute-binding protein [Halomonas sp. A11-A]PWV81546.1 iron(III) transport system substrate-binding protein [Halomonas sp. A11-A]